MFIFLFIPCLNSAEEQGLLKMKSMARELSALDSLDTKKSSSVSPLTLDSLESKLTSAASMNVEQRKRLLALIQELQGKLKKVLMH